MAGLEMTEEIIEFLSKKIGFIGVIYRQGYVETRIEVNDLIHAYLELKKKYEELEQ
jgi:hypothetical protein